MLVENGINGTLINAETTISELSDIMVRTAENTVLREASAKINSELMNDKFNFRKNIARFLDAYGNLAIKCKK